MYNNYHKHDYYGNPWSIDSYTKPEEYCLRAKELGHKTIFTTNHGVTGNIFEYLELAQKYNLKMCYGLEGYLVRNRFEKENRKNKHIIIIAKNNDGVKQLNDIMTESFSTGFYYKPRIDLDLLFSLNSENFIITTACVAGIWDDAELIIALKNKFKNNFFLEVQAHNLDIQKEVNERMLTLNKLENIPLIHANDSHYIYPEDKKYRDIFLRGKSIVYENFEDKMILDYPTEDEIFERYKKQGILSFEQVQEALQNTLIFDECEPITLINDDVKLPSVSSQPMEDLKTIIRKQWLIERKNIPKELWKEYTDAILYELDIVEKTNMANYFLIDYKVAKDAQEKYNGRLTNTGRGCFEGNCYVHTLNGIKQLKDVIIGDKVLTYDGTFQNVLNTMKYDIEEELVEIKHLYGSVKGHNPICTKDHKILVRRNEKNQWIEAQDVLPTDYVCVPKIEFSESIPTTIALNQYNIYSRNARKICERILEDNKYFYLPVKGIIVKPKRKTTVYDLSIENNHNYVINNMTVHNSAPSFYITKLLGLTDIDRVSSPITLFPTRFMSAERILGTRSLPDIDLNTTDRTPFIKATEDLLGAENCAWMVTWKPLQESSAFRTYCKGIGKDISEYDEIAKNLDEYKNDKYWGDIIKESERFVGVIVSVSESPCSMLLYDKSVRQELGLVRTNKGKLCCLLDGYNCDKYKYLKND